MLDIKGENQIALIEAKNSKILTKNVIIRQLYYPFRQWQANTKKKVSVFFFEKGQDIYSFWQFSFEDKKNYNSIKLENKVKYVIK